MFSIYCKKNIVGYIRRMIEDEGRGLESIENWFGKKFMNEVKNII